MRRGDVLRVTGSIRAYCQRSTAGGRGMKGPYVVDQR